MDINHHWFEVFLLLLTIKMITPISTVPFTSLKGAAVNGLQQYELFWFCGVDRARMHHYIQFCSAVIAAVCLFQVTLRTGAGKHFDFVSPHLSRVWPWRTESASDIPPLTGEEVSERMGKRMLGGKGGVQGSWRPRFWMWFLLCKVNRIWMDIHPQVLINKLSLNDR